MKRWQPTIKDVNEMDLVLTTDYGYGTVSTTKIHASEGDTIYIREEKESGSREPQVVSLDRHQLYNLIFNFMSTEELEMIADLKSNIALNELADKTGYEGFRPQQES